MKSDYQKTGKLYPKLDSYMISNGPNCKGITIYLGSSCQFRTQKAYKTWLLSNGPYENLKIKICKGE